MKTIVKPEDKMVIKTGKIDANEIFEEITKGMSAARRAVIRVMLWNKYDKHFDKIRAIAKCSPDDEWNEEFGRNLPSSVSTLNGTKELLKLLRDYRTNFLILLRQCRGLRLTMQSKLRESRLTLTITFVPRNPKTDVSEVRFY